MSVNPYSPPRTSLDEADGLGDIVMSCRSLSAKERAEEYDLSQFRVYYSAVRVLVFLVISAVSVERVSHGDATSIRLVFGAIFMLICGGIFWMHFHRPKQPILALHVAGIRYRKRVFPFEDLVKVQFGRNATTMEASSPKPTRSLGGQNTGSVTLIKKAGKPFVIQNIFWCSALDDLQRFFQTLRSMRPDLLETMPAWVSAMPKVDEMSWKMTSL